MEHLSSLIYSVWSGRVVLTQFVEIANTCLVIFSAPFTNVYFSGPNILAGVDMGWCLELVLAVGVLHLLVFSLFLVLCFV